jgi:hypothetical protein
MKLVKMIMMALAVGLMMAAPALRAQDGGGQKKKGGMTVEQQIAAIDEAVGGLSADQKTKITAILTKQAADIQAIPAEERQAKAGDIRAAARAQVLALLTAEQKPKYEAMPQPGKGGKKKN